MVDYKSLVGRQWQYGVFDCYSIVKDYYELLGINLPDYERPNDFQTCKSIFLNDANKLNFNVIRDIAIATKPKLIICGYSA